MKYNQADKKIGGFMEITWYGHSCFRMVERGKAAVVTDPYAHAAVGYAPLKLRADIVTVSHQAAGHNHLEAVKGVKHVITGPGEYEIGGVFITGFNTNGRKRKQAEPKNTLYLFDFDPLTVLHLGDLRRVPSQSEIEALGEVNIVLVPVGGGGALKPAQAAEVIGLVEPRVVIPMHYRTPHTSLDLLPLEKFLKEMGVSNVRNETVLKITHRQLPEETQVIVLEPRLA